MQDCIFCKIVNKEIPGQIVYEDDLVLAFNDINPLAPVHILIIPKKHLPNLLDMEEGDKELIGHIHFVAQKLAKEKGLSETGFRLVSNHGVDAGQVVFHIHFHLVGGKGLRLFV
jgi:histidine triad (HIT) family protein